MMFRRVKRKKDFFSAHHGDRRIRGDDALVGYAIVRRDHQVIRIHLREHNSGKRDRPGGVRQIGPMLVRRRVR